MKKLKVKNTIEFEEMEQFIGSVEHIANVHETLMNRLSDLDKMQEDLLHIIENEKCSAPRMCAIHKRIREIRQERRDVKNKYDVFQPIHDSFKIGEGGIKKYINNYEKVKQREITYKARKLNLETLEESE